MNDSLRLSSSFPFGLTIFAKFRTISDHVIGNQLDLIILCYVGLHYLDLRRRRRGSKDETKTMEFGVFPSSCLEAE